MRKFVFLFSFIQSIALLIAPFSQANTLTIQGSNTIGAKLAPSLVSGYFHSLGARNLVLTATAENESRITAQQDIVVDIAAHGSGTGFKALNSGLADIAAASRPAKQKEIDQLAELTALTSQRSEHIIGIDGLAIITHPQNPINQLSVEQVAAIFSGEITNWIDLGGRFGEINLYSRDDKSGTWDSFKRMVLGKTELAATALRFEANDELSDRVSRDINGIGFVGLPSVRLAKLMAISDGQGKALKPNQLTISTEDYALSRRLYFYTDDTPKNPHTLSFIQFVQSPAGQKIVAANGFIAQNIEVVEPLDYVSLPLDFQLLAGEGQRLTVNFRFKEGSARLDNRALRDVQRLVDFSHQNPDKKLILIGFGDQKKSKERSQLLSKLRAMAVRRELVKQGIYPKFNYGYGEQLPVASNEREAGKYKNRRVEVWLSHID
jgi:phosphate transport system substrate-binding protein